MSSELLLSLGMIFVWPNKTWICCWPRRAAAAAGGGRAVDDVCQTLLEGAATAGRAVGRGRAADGPVLAAERTVAADATHAAGLIAAAAATPPMPLFMPPNPLLRLAASPLIWPLPGAVPMLTVAPPPPPPSAFNALAMSSTFA